MKKISSFQVDHTKLNPGLYISRIDKDIITYDIRMIKPNTPPFLEVPAIHTIEHIFATYVRNEYPDEIIYFGPMGCRTGFYFITRNLSHESVISLVQRAMNFVSEFSGQIPGSSIEECGNYLEHDLEKAKIYTRNMCEVLKNWDESKLNY